VTFPDSDLATFQVSRPADLAGSTSSFTVDDRQQFPQHAPGVRDDPEFPTGATRRSTLKVGRSRLLANPIHRLTPREAISDAQSLNRFDATKVSLQPGATHRWRIEIPPAPTARDLDTEWSAFLWSQVLAGAGASFTLMPLDGSPGSAGHTLKGAATSVAIGPGSTAAFSTRGSGIDSASTPNCLVGVVTNLGTADISYKASVSLPRACINGGVDHYARALIDQGCLPLLCTDTEST
jgi:hypothetical protein